MKKRVRAAILGTGFIGRVHLEALCRLGFVEIAALATADHGQAERLAGEYGVERVEHDYRRVLDDPDIDVIHVCTPTALHAQMVKDALLAGKHVLSEKPLATSVADAVGTGGARQEARRAQLHQPQPALLPARAAHEAGCASRANWARSWWCRGSTRRTTCSTTPTGTGGSTPRTRARRAPWPTSARTSAT